jgi:hypothetical protein
MDNRTNSKIIAEKLNDVLCEGNISLEPRLQGYLHKKAFNADNDIIPCVPLEKEFLITNDDLAQIRQFLSGKKDIYMPHNNPLNDKKKSRDNNNNDHQLFPSASFRDNDMRMKNSKLKVAKGKQEMKVPVNRGMFAPDNSLYNDENNNSSQHRFRPESPSAFYNDSEPAGKVDQIMDGRDLMSYGGNNQFDKNTRQLSEFSVHNSTNRNFEKHTGIIPNQNPYPNINYHSRVYDEPLNHQNPGQYPNHKEACNTNCGQNCGHDAKHSSDVNKMVGLMNNYNKYDRNDTFDKNSIFNQYRYKNSNSKTEESNNAPFLDKIIGNVPSYTNSPYEMYNDGCSMDTDLKTVTPKVMTNSKRGTNTSMYNAVPFMGKSSDFADADIASDMRNGIPSRLIKSYGDQKFRSYGFSNPSEHYFDYISDDIQNPNNVVMPIPKGGYSTRLDKRETAKKYEREIY